MTKTISGTSHVPYRKSYEKTFILKQPNYNAANEETFKNRNRMNELYRLSAVGDKSHEKELVKLEREFYPGEPDIYIS